VSTKQIILLSVSIVILTGMLLVITFGDNGFVDLRLLQKQKNKLVDKNNAHARENMKLYNKIDRLKHDAEYVENVARQERGMIGKDEILFTFDGASSDDVSNSHMSTRGNEDDKTAGEK